ncbi:hypothetical protein KQH81_07890 [Clostridium cadaveris]|nr:hypothetical protein KQH81_07890 [Clostridium cadaveris]
MENVLRGKIIKLITRRKEVTQNEFKDYLEVRQCLLSYGRWLEKNKLEDNITTYENFLVNYLN